MRPNRTFRPTLAITLEPRDVPSTLVPDWPTYPVGPSGDPNYVPASVPIPKPPLIGDFNPGDPGLV